MIKKSMLFAAVAMALASFAASMAQGTSGLKWTDKSGEKIIPLLSGENPTITAFGKAKFNNVTLGGTECPVKAEVQLTGNTSTAHVTEFVVTNTAECVLNGALATSCQNLTEDVITNTNSVRLTTANGGAWLATGTLNASVASLDITSAVIIHNTYGPKPEPDGKLCPKQVTLESTATAKPTITFDSSTMANQGTLGGTLTATFGEPGTHLGNVNITGTLTIQAPNGGTYGIK